MEDTTNGETIIESGQVVIEGQPGGYVISEIITNRLGLTLKTRTLLYSIYYDSRIIMISCGVTGLDGKIDLSQKMEKFRPVFSLIANSLILNDKYK